MGNRIQVLDNRSLKELIYTIRDKQVMLDRDLATLYQIPTSRLNEAVKRNLKRFPERFMFQLTETEQDFLISQIATPKSEKRGGSRFLPYAFTEQGIAMLSSVLKSDIAIEISINIMDAFVEMRKFIANNQFMLEKINSLELKQLETDKKFEEVFNYISSKQEPAQKIFFCGQIYDAFGLLIKIIQQAESKIVLVDNYVNIDTLNILCKKQKNVSIDIYTTKKTSLTDKDVEIFNKQYPTLNVHTDETFHDRFLILDDRLAYHIGASIKDAGKKSFALTKIEDQVLIDSLLSRLTGTKQNH